ncbi:MAG: SRPBCC domain-containing protein, partial [Amnibacterium sp.]
YSTERNPMTDRRDEAPRILGTLHAVDGRGLVRIRGRVDAAPEVVWAALTDPARLADWLGSVEGDLREGGAYHGRFRVSEWDGTGRILVCEPPRRLVVSASEDDHDVQDEQHVTTITVAPDSGGSAILVEEQGMPLAMIAAYGAGTQVHVEDLVAYVGGSPERHTADRFGVLWPGYKALPVESA